MTKEGILNIIQQLEDSLRKLKNIKKSYTSVKFTDNQEIQDITKWNFYVAVQACLDIGSHIIAEQSLGSPETYEDILEILKKNKKISLKLFNNLRGLAGFRNRLAHGYFKLDGELLYKYLANIKDIESYLHGLKYLLKL